MSSRDQILDRVRRALGREAGDRVAPAPPVRLAQPDTGDLVSRFSAAVMALGGSVIEAAGQAEAQELVESMIAGRKFVCSSAPVLKSMGLAQKFSRGACAYAEIGVTSADYALADTGSLVFFTESGESRLISLLPHHHVAVIGRDKILASLDQLLGVVPSPLLRSSAMVLVTGPSRTADIEMRLVRGVHGPGDITVVIIK